MGALPKRKRAKSHKGGRLNHLNMSIPALVACSQCHNLKLSHVVCPFCGTYAGREVIQPKSSKTLK